MKKTILFALMAFALTGASAQDYSLTVGGRSAPSMAYS